MPLKVQTRLRAEAGIVLLVAVLLTLWYASGQLLYTFRFPFHLIRALLAGLPM